MASIGMSPTATVCVITSLCVFSFSLLSFVYTSVSVHPTLLRRQLRKVLKYVTVDVTFAPTQLLSAALVGDDV